MLSVQGPLPPLIPARVSKQLVYKSFPFTLIRDRYEISPSESHSYAKPGGGGLRPTFPRAVPASPVPKLRDDRSARRHTRFGFRTLSFASGPILYRFPALPLRSLRYLCSPASFDFQLSTINYRLSLLPTNFTSNSCTINTYASQLCNPCRMNTYTNAALKTLWNEHLQKKCGRGCFSTGPSNFGFRISRFGCRLSTVDCRLPTRYIRWCCPHELA